MPRFARMLSVLTLLMVATVAHGNDNGAPPSTPPAYGKNHTAALGSNGNGVANAFGRNRVGSVPEPETLGLTLVGLLGAFLARRRKR